MEARDHGMSVESSVEFEWARFRAYGNQLIGAHIALRGLLEDVYDAVESGAEVRPGLHCLAFCDAVTTHHTAEDDEVFPLLARRHPELRAFLDELRRDHEVIAVLLDRLRTAVTVEELDGISAVLETHFIGEEKRLVGVLNALGDGEEGGSSGGRS